MTGDRIMRHEAKRAPIWLGFLLVGTLIKGIIWMFVIFPFDAPDEPSHFSYITQLQNYHELPVVVMPTADRISIPPSTPQDAATQAMIHRFGFSDFESLSYESSQPPLFYIAASLLTAPLGKNQLALLYGARLVAVLCGVGAVWALWAAAGTLWPGQPHISWVAPLVLTLHPQFTFVTSTITNDACVFFLGTLLLWIWAKGLQSANRHDGGAVWRWVLLAGVVTGLGLLAKLTMIVTLPCTLLWLWWIAGARGGGMQRRLQQFTGGALVVGGAVILLVGWWVLRNLLVYGEPTGTKALFELYHVHFRNEAPISLGGTQPDLKVLGQSIAVAIFSFWALYGWGIVLLPPWEYAGPLLLAGLAVLGGARAIATWRAGAPPDEQTQVRRRIAGLSVLVLFVSLIDLILFNVNVAIQPQSRYLFVGLASAILLLLALKSTTRVQLFNKILVWSLPAMLVLMQLGSLAVLLDRWIRGANSGWLLQ